MATGPEPNMQQLLAQAQRMQQQLMEAQQQLAQARVDGSAGGGLVTATVTGSGQLVGLVIDASAVDPDDTETLADLVLAAVRDATANASALQEQSMAPLTEALGGMGGALPGLPGLGF